MRKKLRANDDLRTRFRPSCLNKSLEVNDGVETLGVKRDGDNINKENRNPSLDKRARSVRRNENKNIRKSRRPGCETPLFTEPFGSVCEIRADGTGHCPPEDYSGPFSALFYHPKSGGQGQLTVLGSASVGDIKLDDWYHVVFIKTNDVMLLYVNGEPVSGSIKPLGNALKGGVSDGITIGGVDASTWAPDAIFNGRMDQISVWSRAVSFDEVQTLYDDGSGVISSNWSDSLKSDLKLLLEFPEEIHTQDSVAATVTNLVDSSELPLVYNTSSPTARTITKEGKVSNFSFTPSYVDELAYPVKDMPQAKATVVSSQTTPHQTIKFSGNIAQESAYTMSAWISPHGMACSANTAFQLNDVNTQTFQADGETWQKTYGVIFSDYSGYSKNVDANFTISFRGRFQNDPNASSLVPPGRSLNLTALPKAPGKVNNLTAAGSLFLIPNFNFNHAAMSANQSIFKTNGQGRFKNSAGFGSNAIGLRATKWLIELHGTGEAPVRSDNGLGGTVAAFIVGQQEPPGNGTIIHDGSWCLQLNTDNHEGFRPVRNTFFAHNHQDRQTYFIVLSSHSLVGRYRWQSQTNLFEKRFPIFGTHESSSGIFGVDLTLINNLKDLSFRVMDENSVVHEVITPNFTEGTAEQLPVTLISLQVNYNSSEDSAIFINGHKTGSLTSRGKPAHILNKQYRVSTDSISFAEGPTVGFGGMAKPEHYTRLNLHELAHLDENTHWWNHPDSQAGPIPSPLNEVGEGYLAHKWHIDHLLPADHPYKNNPPVI